MTLSKITPLEAKRLVDDGGVLVDIRGRDEHARERIPGARNLPLGSAVKVETSAPVVFHCRSGGRTSANAATLAQAANSEAYILDGGLDAWKRAGLPVVVDRTQPIDIIRQVQIAAGSLVLATGRALQNAIASSLFAVTAFGLTTAGNYAFSGFVDWRLAALVIAGGVKGSLVGTRANAKLQGHRRALAGIFAAVVISVGIYIIAQGFPALLGHA